MLMVMLSTISHRKLQDLMVKVNSFNGAKNNEYVIEAIVDNIHTLCTCLENTLKQLHCGLM